MTFIPLILWLLYSIVYKTYIDGKYKKELIQIANRFMKESPLGYNHRGWDTLYAPIIKIQDFDYLLYSISKTSREKRKKRLEDLEKYFDEDMKRGERYNKHSLDINYDLVSLAKLHNNYYNVLIDYEKYSSPIFYFFHKIVWCNIVKFTRTKLIKT